MHLALRFMRSRSGCAITALAAIIQLTGCAVVPSTARLHPTATARLGEIQTATAAPPQLTLSQLSAGGVREKRDDWTDAARIAAIEALAQVRPGRIVSMQDPASMPEIQDELAEVQALYRAIAVNLIMFGSPPIALPTLANRFEFSVGNIDRILDATGGDALLIIYGEDDYFTGDRKALMALGFVAAMFTGVYIQPGNGIEYVGAALVARDGAILWHDFRSAGGIADLRNPEGVKTTIDNLLKSLPETAAVRGGE